MTVVATASRLAVSLLLEGHIIPAGFKDGFLEFGPRAAGNRSLLADPREGPCARPAQSAGQTSAAVSIGAGASVLAERAMRVV